MRLGIDIGGTKIEAAVLDDRGAIIARRRVPTPRGYDAVVGQIVQLVAELEKQTSSRLTVGIGCPGSKCPHSGVMKNAENVGLDGRCFDDDLANALDRPVRLANDAHCFALSESTDGAAAGARVVFGVIVGTGTGGGIVVDGRILPGANAITGEWGHNPLPSPRNDELPGVTCYCGRRGCIEAYLSGPALGRDHQLVHGQAKDGHAIAQGAAAGDAACQDTLERYAERMARALSWVINLLDPDVIVLGGGVSQIDALYQLVPSLWGPHVLSDSICTRLVKNQHGDASGVRGAAWLWNEHGRVAADLAS